jgi:electron transfer flavoprotein beta subunit
MGPMNIIVCVKQVPDTETKIRVKNDASGIETGDIKWIMNPYDEFAVEEALKTRDRLADGSTVTVFTLGPKARAVEVLRTALAMGADNAVLVDTPDTQDSNSTARALAEAIKKEAAWGTVFTGKQAIDDDCAQVSQQLGQYLGIPHSTVVVKFDVAADKNSATVQREVEGGTKEVVELKFPAVIAADKGLNSPRYASLPGIMKAKKKEIKEYAFASLGVAGADRKIVYEQFLLPPPRPAGKFLDGDASAQAAALVKALREEAKVI